MVVVYNKNIGRVPAIQVGNFNFGSGEHSFPLHFYVEREMDNFRIFSVSDRYIEYLSQKKGFTNVCSNNGNAYIKSRKYIGVTISISDFCYYIPLSSPKSTDYILLGETTKIRKSIIPIIRIISKNEKGIPELKGTLRLSNMIPVPESELILYDIDSELDFNYKSLIQKELVFIRKNKEMIKSNANILYRQKLNGDKSAKYVNFTLDFKLLEQACDEFIRIQKGDVLT